MAVMNTKPWEIIPTLSLVANPRPKGNETTPCVEQKQQSCSSSFSSWWPPGRTDNLRFTYGSSDLVQPLMSYKLVLLFGFGTAACPNREWLTCHKITGMAAESVRADVLALLSLLRQGAKRSVRFGNPNRTRMCSRMRRKGCMLNSPSEKPSNSQRFLSWSPNLCVNLLLFYLAAVQRFMLTSPLANDLCHSRKTNLAMQGCALSFLPLYISYQVRLTTFKAHISGSTMQYPKPYWIYWIDDMLPTKLLCPFMHPVVCTWLGTFFALLRHYMVNSLLWGFALLI